MRKKIELLSIIFIICTLNNCEGTNVLSKRATEEALTDLQVYFNRDNE